MSEESIGQDSATEASQPDSGGPDPRAFGIASFESAGDPGDSPPPSEEASSAEPDKGGSSSASESPEELASKDSSGDQNKTPAAQPASKFRFLDRDWDSPSHAEQAVKSWDGRIRALNEEKTQLIRQMNDYYKYVQQASEILNGGNGKGASPQGNREDTAESKPKKFSEALDWEQISEIQKIAQATGRDPGELTNRYIAEQLDGYIDGRLGDLETKAMEPVQASRDADNFRVASAQSFVWARDLRDDHGNLFYPELGGNGPDSLDEKFAESMFSGWHAIASQYPDFAFTHAGLDYAYRLALGAKPQNGAPATAAPAAKPKDTAANVSQVSQVARDEKGRFVKEAKAASDSADPDSADMVPDGEESEDDKFFKSIPRPVRTKGGIDLGFMP